MAQVCSLYVPKPIRRSSPGLAAPDLPAQSDSHVLSVDAATAGHWGELMARSRSRGIALSVMDGFLAATALAHGLTLVTRNSRDFLPFDIPLLDPWSG